MDPQILRLPDDLGVKRETEEESTRVLRNFAKSGGAEICVIGDSAPFQNQLGISLHAYGAGDSLLSESYGEIPIRTELTALTSKSLKYIAPSDGIFAAGLGGISKPTWLNCSPPGSR